MKNQFKNKRAFTLIELLIVIAIIGILFIVLVSKVDFATDKAKASGVQTDFRSFQLAFDTVAKENAGFNTFGYNTGDNAGTIPDGYAFESTEAENKTKGDGIRNSYDQGDKNLNGKQDGTEVWTGRKIYTETWTEVYTLVKPGTTGLDADAIFALESAINKNLDPKLHITINADGTIAMANQARDPWKNEYHGVYISQAERDHGADRGAIIIYSNGANGKWGSAHDITNGVVTVTVPGNNTYGKDDYSIVSCYTFINGYGEVLNMSTGFSNNQSFNGNTPSVVPGGNGGTEPDVNEPIPVVTGATFRDGTTLSWEELQLPENGTKYGYSSAGITNTSIEDEAFRYCSNLTSVVIPDSVTSIGERAFHYCNSLESVTIGNSVTNIAPYAFHTCLSLTSVTIPDSVTSISDHMFFQSSSLTNITIPDSVTKIGEGAFNGCTGLTSIVIPDSVTSIGISAFGRCNSLTNIIIPNSVTSIGLGAFTDCNNLTSVTIGNGVTSIGTRAFRDCDSLTNISVDVNNEYYSSIDGNLYDKTQTTLIQYAKGKTNTHFVIPSTVTSIGYDAFHQCDSLTNVTIPDSVISIGGYAFYSCDNLTSIVIPDSVTGIGSYAFSGCTSLTSVTIPDSVKSIGNGIFYKCTSLESVTIPNSVTSIIVDAFSGCTNLTSITFNGTIAQWSAISKDSQWHKGVPATYVQCSDGQVDL